MLLGYDVWALDVGRRPWAQPETASEWGSARVGVCEGAHPPVARRGEFVRGDRTLSTLLAHITATLSNAFVGIALGLVLAAVFLWMSRSSMTMIRPGRAEAGVALAALSLFGRLAAATLLLWGYKALVPSGFKPFALAFAGGFLVMYTVELVRYAGLQRYRRPTAAVRE